jgi:hypothetical protein
MMDRGLGDDHGRGRGKGDVGGLGCWRAVRRVMVAAVSVAGGGGPFRTLVAREVLPRAR